MNELIKITEYNGQQAVSARELHTFLESNAKFYDWIVKHIEEYDLVENQDYVILTSTEVKIKRGRPKKDYALSINCAKEISMVQKSDKGKIARQYFIDRDNELRAIKQKALTSQKDVALIAQEAVKQAIGSEIIQLKSEVENLTAIRDQLKIENKELTSETFRLKNYIEKLRNAFDKSEKANQEIARLFSGHTEPAPMRVCTGKCFMVDYSEKSVAVFGDTQDIEDKFEKLGGKHNEFLKYNGQKQEGWIFPLSKKEDVEKLIA